MAIIEVEHLTKEYRLGQLESLKTTFLNQVRRLTGKPLEQRALFKALADVSFKIEEGEVVGIIGHNGAGKSTLLKLLANITSPTSGHIRVKGRIAPLIEVGAGFIGDLTGRENVYLNGSILGLSRKVIDSKFEEIVEFSEMAEFIDTPVKRYSSGMKVKLAFSVATSIESEILIIDEVLAVGDLAFQRKCFDRIERLLRSEGRTVLIVGHNIRQIERISSRILLLDHGKILEDGPSGEIATLYYDRTNAAIAHTRVSEAGGHTRVKSSGEVEWMGIDFYVDGSDKPAGVLKFHRPVRAVIRFRANVALNRCDFGFGFHTSDFVYISTFHTGHIISFEPGEHKIEAYIQDLPLAPGVYGIRAGFHDQYFRILFHGENLYSVTVAVDNPEERPVTLQSLVDLPIHWASVPAVPLATSSTEVSEPHLLKA